MFTISTETRFTASHQLTLPDGSKEPSHCHNWLVAAVISGSRLNKMGLLMDFNRLKTLLGNITAELQTGRIEKLPYFRKNNSSAEAIAKYIYEKLSPKLPKNVRLKYVKIVEEPGCSAKFGR